MRKFITALLLVFPVWLSQAVDLSFVYMSSPDTIYADEPFYLDWGTTISSDIGETQSEMTIRCDFYLSRDNVLNEGDVFLRTDEYEAAATTGFFNQAVYDVVLTSEMEFPKGKWFIIMDVDPVNTIPESNEANNQRAYDIVVATHNADLALQTVEPGRHPSEEEYLNIKTIISNPGAVDISSYQYSISLANSLEELSAPLVSDTFSMGAFPALTEVIILENSLDLSGKIAGLNNHFFTLVRLGNILPGDEDGLNNEIILEADWDQLNVLEFLSTKVFMTNRNDSLYTCNAVIYDDGGEFNQYSPSINSTIRVFPTEPNSVVALTLQPNFSLFAFDDYIEFYNPDNMGTPLATLYMINSTGSPRTFISGAADGSLVVKFVTNSSNQNDGFEILAQCIDTTKMVFMKSNRKKTITTCGATVYDNGAGGNYGANAKDTLTIFPEQDGQNVILTFNEFATENCCDRLFVYDGPDRSAPLIGTYNGTNGPGTVTSTGGALTLYFESDYSAQDKGFEAEVSCTPVLSNSPVRTEKQDLFYIVPNPNNGKFRLEAAGGHATDEKAHLVIYNSRGQVMLQTEVRPDETVDLEQTLPAGMYMLEIIARNQKQVSQFVID